MVPTLQEPDRLPSPRWTTAVAALSAVVMTLDITIVTVALPSIGTDLKLSLDGTQWVVNAYTLTFAAALLAAGSLSDRVGRRTILLLGHVVFTLSSAVCALSTSESVLVAGRGVQGLGAAMVFGAVMPLVADCYGPDESARRTRAIATVTAISGAAAGVGPLLGGWLVDLGDWRLAFAVNVPVCLVALILTILTVPDRHRLAGTSRAPGSPPVDPLSVALAVPGLFALNYAVLTGPGSGWTDVRVVGAAVVAVVVLAAFVLRQSRRGHLAMVDLTLFRIPSFAAVTVLGFAVRMFSFGLYPFVILWLAGPVGLSPTGVGLVLLAMALPMLVTAIPAARLQTWFRVGHILGAGMSIAALGLLLGLVVGPGSSWTALLPSFIVIGIGSGLSFPYLMDIAVSVVPPTRSGTATGVANTAFPLGTSFGVALYGAVLSSTVHDALTGAPNSVIAAATVANVRTVAHHAPQWATTAEHAFVSGLDMVFLLAACVAAIAAVAAAVGIRESDRWRPESRTDDAGRAGTEPASARPS